MVPTICPKIFEIVTLLGQASQRLCQIDDMIPDFPAGRSGADASVAVHGCAEVVYLEAGCRGGCRLPVSAARPASARQPISTAIAGRRAIGRRRGLSVNDLRLIIANGTTRRRRPSQTGWRRSLRRVDVREVATDRDRSELR